MSIPDRDLPVEHAVAIRDPRQVVDQGVIRGREFLEKGSPIQAAGGTGHGALHPVRYQPVLLYILGRRDVSCSQFYAVFGHSFTNRSICAQHVCAQSGVVRPVYWLGHVDPANEYDSRAFRADRRGV